MKTKKRQKLCYNCEGEIDLDVIVCPFCAADLRSEKPEQLRAGSASSTARPLHSQAQMSESLYPSPYAPRQIPETLPEAPLETPAPVQEAVIEPNSRRMIGPTLLFTAGAQLCLFGLFMFLFSHDGSLILKWNARMWFLYLIASAPLLIFGYRSLSKLN